MLKRVTSKTDCPEYISMQSKQSQATTQEETPHLPSFSIIIHAI